MKGGNKHKRNTRLCPYENVYTDNYVLNKNAQHCVIIACQICKNADTRYYVITAEKRKSVLHACKSAPKQIKTCTAYFGLKQNIELENESSATQLL